ncbi:hypothetical protein [Priestia koreensis]|uniref:hypothetical protein n=1 Tax=Priestia koreensis TaxID=284581 RepID=UPI0030184B82
MRWEKFEKYYADQWDTSIPYEKKMKSQEVVADYYNFKSSLSEEEITPALQKVNDAKQKYLEAIKGLVDIEKNHENYFERTKALSSGSLIDGAELHIAPLLDYQAYKLPIDRDIQFVVINKTLPEGK